MSSEKDLEGRVVKIEVEMENLTDTVKEIKVDIGNIYSKLEDIKKILQDSIICQKYACEKRSESCGKNYVTQKMFDFSRYVYGGLLGVLFIVMIGLGANLYKENLNQQVELAKIKSKIEYIAPELKDKKVISEQDYENKQIGRTINTKKFDDGSKQIVVTEKGNK